MYDIIVQILEIEKTDTIALDLVDTLLELCTNEAITYTREKEVEKLEDLIIKMVIERYNKLDYDGISSVGYSGVSQHFESDYSDTVKRLIKAKRHLKLI